MTQYHEYLHQKSRVEDYHQQISGALFQLYRILTTHFPDTDIATIIKMQNIVDNELTTLIDNLSNDNGV
jgi:hypothetical protein